jgi:hypothetical protein
MVTLTGAVDYVWLFLTAAISGAVGGLAYELLRPGRSDTPTGEIETSGWLRVPFYRGQPRPPIIELGVFSSLIVGAIAAVAAAYFFTPEVQVKEMVRGVEVVTTKWQIVKVVPLSLIVGSAGGAFLTAMQSRVLAQVNAERVESAKAVGKATNVSVAENGKAAVGRALATLAARVQPRAEQSVREAASGLPEPVYDHIDSLPSAADPAKAFLLEHPRVVPDRAVADLNTVILTAIDYARTEAEREINEQLDTARATIDDVPSGVSAVSRKASK